MECGRQCFVIFMVALVALSLLITCMSTPYQLVFITKPYARIVLTKGGQLDSWTAEKLDLDPSQFEMVKRNHREYLEKNRRTGGDDSDDSDDSEYDAGFVMDADLPGYQDNTSDWPMPEVRRAHVGADSSDSSDSVEGEESSESSDSDLTIGQRLENQPLQRTISIGLFIARICTISQNHEEDCTPTSVSESFDILGEEVIFIDQEINLPIWNDLRIESLLSTVACCIGIVCILASLRPCCIHRNVPVYLGAMFFAISGLMVFIPIVRVLMISGDFREMLVSELNITTSLGFSWSLLAAGASVPFSVLVSILLMASIWAKTKRIVRKLLKGEPEVNEAMHQERYSDLVKGDLNRLAEPEVGFGRGTVVYSDVKTEHA